MLAFKYKGVTAVLTYIVDPDVGSKVHFVVHSLIPPFSTRKVEIFTSSEAFRYIMYVCRIFLANSFV